VSAFQLLLTELFEDQLTVNQSDSELGVHRYGMKKNNSTLDPIMLEDEL